jgi:hypothetical protein
MDAVTRRPELIEIDSLPGGAVGELSEIRLFD